MKNNKGFTLVELLATIIILAIVLLIAIPTVLSTISKTKKRAFADSAIVVGKDAYNKLNVDFLNGENKLPEDGQNTYIDIDDLNNDDFDRFTGKVRINNENDKYKYYITLDDGEYYLCDVLVDEISVSKVTNENTCETNDNEEESNIVKDDNITRIKTGYVNGPVLIKGMTPVIWDESGNIKETTVDDENWFEYSATAKRWANAQTEDGSLWVWIPRYAYQITRSYHSSSYGTIEIKYLENLTDVAYDKTAAIPVNQGNNPGSNTKFVTHPAFKFGDTELYGIWIMKFEASNKDGKVTSEPNATAYGNLNVSDMFDYSRSMELDNTYGWGTTGENLDSHMFKDVEWGAAVYLSWSTYGKASEIWVNNSSKFTTGCAGSSVSAATFAGCQNVYNSAIGQNASTTGNYYGMYDMNGGAIERTASYLVGGDSILATNGASLVAADPKYIDKYLGSSTSAQTNYDLNSKYYGNAVYETSSQGTSTYAWNSDTSNFMRAAAPFTARGARYDLGANSGPFSFSDANGIPHATNTFRVSLIVQKGL